jgi:D-alanine transaminase
MTPLANVEGKILPLAEVFIPVLDRGFLFGDAIYEVLRVYQGRPWLEDDHFARLKRSLAEVRINGVDVARLRQRMHDTIAAGSFREATVYIQVTRGVAPRAHPFPPEATPTEILWVSEFIDPYAEARRAGTSVALYPDIRWDRCDIKSTNLLGNVLAMQAAKEAGGVEAVLYLPDGTLTEGSHSSFFGVRDGAIRMPPNSHEILPGCTRGFVMGLAAKLGFRTEERPLTRDELPQAQETFLTGTTTEVLPVVRVDRQVIGDGKPGPVTLRLQEAYAGTVRRWLAGSDV